MNIKVSVIMPVYGVEQYLPKAIDSMVNQTLKDIEIIIVDDGSPDNCGRIADEYAAKDERITVVHQKNGGAANARNSGIKIARGDYLYFLDPDDWAEPAMLEDFYNCCAEKDANLLIAGFTQEFFENNKSMSLEVRPEGDIFYEDRNSFRNNAHKYLGNTMLAVPWNKLYKTSYIREHKLWFPEIAWDDLHFNMEVMMDMDKVYICDATYYHFFRSRPGSETTKVFDGGLFKKRKEQFRHVLKLYRYWNITNSKITGEVYAYYAERLVQCVQEIGSANTLSAVEKNERIEAILTDRLTKKALALQKSRSVMLKICILVLKTGNVSLCRFMGQSIGIFKKYFGLLFQKMKTKAQRK